MVRPKLPDSGVPTPVRAAGLLVSVQGATAVVVALVLVIRGAAGADESVINGFGTAIWFAALGGAVLTGGIALILGHRWGRAIAIVAQLLLLPVVWSLLTDSGRPVLGSLLGIVVIGVLVCLFSGPATRWLADDYVETDDA
ncbi:hypothetical protein [Rhodococcus sp. NBC_00297]|uniref:hypothetical protein n=1 Tax=Rhodococcus sp. NBC_00297 TaxID=2976005 RepID=UPI003FA79F1B